MFRRQWFSKPDIPFARDDAGRFLPWIVACMACLTALLLAAALSVNHALAENHDAYSHTLTVHIPHVPDGGDATKATRAVIELLAGTPGISGVTLLEKDQLQRLISPWLGENAELELLPMPEVIEASFDEGAADLDALRAQLRDAVPTAELQGPELWVEKFSSFNHAVRLAALALGLLLLANTLGMVALAARTALKLHRHIVILLHSIGAQDDYIVRQFQANAFALTLKGAGAGTLAAAAIFSLFSWIVRGMDAPLLPALAWSWPHAAAFAALPFLTSLAALYVARRTVFSELEAMP